jgi:hypothetical protein
VGFSGGRAPRRLTIVAILIVVAFLIAVVAGAMGSVPANAATTVSAGVRNAATLPAGCKPFVFLGFRGSGEALAVDADRNGYGLGPTLGPIYRGLASAATYSGKISWAYSTPTGAYAYAPRAVPSFSADSTTAWGPYLDDLLKLNSERISAAVTSIHVKCPQSALFLAGYSQGAYAVQLAYQNSMRKDFWGYFVRGLVLVGNPGEPTGFVTDMYDYCANGGASSRTSFNQLADSVTGFCTRVTSYAGTFAEHAAKLPSTVAPMPVKSVSDSADILAHWTENGDTTSSDMANAGAAVSFFGPVAVALAEANVFVSNAQTGIAAHEGYKNSSTAATSVRSWARALPTRLR